MAALAFFFKKNRKEKSKIMITGMQKIENVSKSSFVSVTNNIIRRGIMEKTIIKTVMIKFLL